jgi:hypothetical protein
VSKYRCPQHLGASVAPRPPAATTGAPEIGVRVKRPSRLVLVTASLTVVGLLVGGTAYAMTSRGDAETYRACVNNRTGAIRMLLDRRDGKQDLLM